MKDLLFRINRKSYPAYKDTKGSYRFPGYVLSIDHVQGDPFAAPSKLSLHIKAAQAGFPEALYATREMRIALQDQLIRGFASHIEKYSFRAKGSGKSGLISISRPGQEILERSACTMDAKNGDLTLRLEVGFPANGRTVNSGELIKILFDFLPVCVKASLPPESDAREAGTGAGTCRRSDFIRKELATLKSYRFCRKRCCSSAGIRRVSSSDEKRNFLCLTGFHGSHTASSKPRSADRYGDPVWYHADRWWRLSRQIHCLKRLNWVSGNYIAETEENMRSPEMTQ